MNEYISGRSPASIQRRFPCAQCGAKLAFEPGAQALQCPYCGHENPIEAGAQPVEELDFQLALRELEQSSATREATVIRCDACAAQVERPPNVTALRCPFCGSNLVIRGGSTRHIRPQSLLPFKITRAQAQDAFRNWLRRLWFAPSALKNFAAAEQGLQGVYTPYWTYDCETQTRYSGQRGDDYYETQTFTSIVNGKQVVQTRKVRKTRWTPVRGTVSNSFDDLLVLASQSLPAKFARKLAPWDLENLTPYQDEYLSGFQAESYTIDLPSGFETARELMQPEIEATIRGDIGGDHQRIEARDTRYFDIRFKHLLLPVWLSAYRYRERVFRFLVNARTGEVQGERPWSAAKIAALVLSVLAGVGLAIWWFAAR